MAKEKYKVTWEDINTRWYDNQTVRDLIAPYMSEDEILYIIKNPPFGFKMFGRVRYKADEVDEFVKELSCHGEEFPQTGRTGE